jgi:hypothetical protein
MIDKCVEMTYLTPEENNTSKKKSLQKIGKIYSNFNRSSMLKFTIKLFNGRGVPMDFRLWKLDLQCCFCPAYEPSHHIYANASFMD